jgi:ribosomal protein S18 acetylase RimI-like enzyme
LEIERLYVLKEYHGKQVGALLYEQALAISKERKAPYIWLGVWEENPRAIRFYQKQGLVEFGEHIFQLADDEQRDVLMKKTLPDLFKK